MRKYIDIVESVSDTPVWFARGERVDPDNLGTVNDDVNDILEPEEWDWDWRLCRVPLSVFEPISRPTFKNPLHLPSADNDSDVRLDRIRQQGEPNPIIVALNLSGAEVLDGHHRLWVAKERGQTSIAALVGKPGLNEGTAFAM